MVLTQVALAVLKRCLGDVRPRGCGIGESQGAAGGAGRGGRCPWRVVVALCSWLSDCAPMLVTELSAFPTRAEAHAEQVAEALEAAIIHPRRAVRAYGGLARSRWCQIAPRT